MRTLSHACTRLFIRTAWKNFFCEHMNACNCMGGGGGSRDFDKNPGILVNLSMQGLALSRLARCPHSGVSLALSCDVDSGPCACVNMPGL